MGRMHAAGMLFVVAPYEADAQLVALARARRIQYVLSDDADLLCYWTSNSTWGVVRNFDARTMAGELWSSGGVHKIGETAPSLSKAMLHEHFMPRKDTVRDGAEPRVITRDA